MTVYGVTPAGFVTKRLAVIKSELEADFKATFGESIDLDPEEPIGQIIGIMSEREAKIWEVAEGIYYSAYPDTAEGVPLDNALAYTGVRRKTATKSKVTATLTATNGTTIPQGSIASVSGNPEARFVLDADVVVGGSGHADGAFTAEEAGSVSAPAESLTVIETPVSGWSAITNALDAEVGNALESDANAKIRRQQSVQKAGAGTDEAIRARILEIPGVTAALVFSNRKGYVVDDRPPHSFQAIVQGGEDDDIANAIWLAESSGIEPYGDVSVDVTDSQGFTQTVSFSRPTAVNIWVEIDVTGNTDPTEGDVYPVNGDDLVKAAIIAFGAALTLGKDVIVYPKLVAALANVPGVLDLAVRIGTSESPTEDDNISIAAFAIADFDTSRITVNN